VWLRIGAGAVLAGNSMVLSLAVNLSDATQTERLTLQLVLLAMALTTIGLLGWPLLRAAIDQIRHRRIPFEGLFLAAICGAFGASVWAMQDPQGDVYFEVISILLVIYAFGQEIGSLGRARVVRSLERWIPEDVMCDRIRPDGGLERVAATSIQRGEVIRIKPGEVIPVDGRIQSGHAFVSEAEITGESFSAAKEPGARVYAGTRPVDGTIDVCAESTATSSQIERIVNAVHAARRTQAPIERQVDRLAAFFLPIVLLVAGATFVVWTLQSSINDGIFNAMAVLLIACPCAMGFATPIAIWATLGRLASQGLVAHGGDTIEALATVDVAIFDKTGTLTDDRTELIELIVEPHSPFDASLIRELAITVQRGSQHPVAAALAELELSGAHGKLAVESMRVLPGIGVEATVHVHARDTRHLVQIGEATHLVADQHAWAVLCQQMTGASNHRKLAIVIDSQVAGLAVVGETSKQSVHSAFSALSKLGIRTMVLTGDQRSRAASLPADEVCARQTPDDKLARVEALQAEGRRVLFVGDGINDSPALAVSDVSIAVGTGTPLAISSGDIVWHGRDLRAIPTAIHHCRAALRMIRSNLLIAGTYNTVGIIAAALGLIHPILAAVLMTVSSLTVSLRASTLGSSRPTLMPPKHDAIVRDTHVVPMVSQPQLQSASIS